MQQSTGNAVKPFIIKPVQWLLGLYKRKFIKGKQISVGCVWTGQQRWRWTRLRKTSQDVCKCHCFSVITSTAEVMFS